MSFYRRLFVSVAWVVALMWAFVAAVLLGGPYSRPAEAAQVVTTTADDGGGACTCSCACQAPPVPACSSDAGAVKDAGSDAREAGLDAREAGSDARDAGGATPTPDAGACGPRTGTGSGFYTSGTTLCDANGVPFRIRGFNVNHLDSVAGNLTGLNNANPSAARLVYDIQQYGYSDAQVNGFVQGYINAKIVAIPGNWAGTCNESAATLTTMVNFWKARTAWLKSVERYTLLNIANEWGASSSTAWRDQYVLAISQLRAAGITNAIVVDAGGCGQDAPDLVLYGAAVAASDPQKNVILDAHVYGQYCVNPGCQSWQQELLSSFDSFARIGVPILIGEFGPGRNVGPSPTTITPGAVIRAAEARGFGWLAWAVDDVAYNADDSNFALMKNAGISSYSTSNTADLTTFGKDVIENPTYGVKATAKKATVF